MYYCGVLSKKNILPMFPFGGMGWRKKKLDAYCSIE